MSKVKSPTEKKRDSLLRDHRNAWSEGPAWSRKQVLKAKRRKRKAQRRAFAEELRTVKGTSAAVDGDLAENRARERFAKQKHSGFEKLPDEPLALVIDRKLEERASNQEKQDEQVQFVGLHKLRQMELRRLRQIRRR